MIKLSISIMHCSWNADRVRMLQRVMDRLGDISSLTSFSISDDVDKSGIWYNCKQAWQQAHPESTHHLVLQDDMLPSINFISTLHRILELKPEEIVHIFACNPIAIKVWENGQHWYTTEDGSWGGAIILPKRHFEWYRWVDEYCSDFHPHCDDTRLDHYAMCHQLPIYCIVPSLIEHIGYDKSLIGNSTSPWRMSQKYVGEVDPLTLDWSLGADAPVAAGITWGTAYEDLHNHLKPQHRQYFMEKLGYGSKLYFPR